VEAAPMPGENQRKGLEDITVPDALSLVSRFEPSGLLWRSDLARYLVVSDDTGHREKGKHSPWIFSMSSAGVVDPEPIVIDGVERLNDLESITTDGSDGFFILCSQSHSRKGKRPKSRTLMTWVKKRDGNFMAKSVASLADSLNQEDPTFHVKLGLSLGTRDLEIEAMTFYQGELYLGLKAPQDKEGYALIWKMKSPRSFLESGDIKKAELSLWGRVKAPAKSDGRLVPGGLSELLFLPDGGLLFTSTPSRSDGVRATGFLSFIKKPEGGVMQAKVIEEFEGHKPEGLSLSPTPGQVMIVFDAGQQTPSWIQVPWPT